MRQAIVMVVILCSSSLLLAEAAWPQKAGDGCHSFFTSAPAVDTPGVYWVINDVQDSAVGGPSTVIGENDDIYTVCSAGASYSIVELDRKGDTVRTYLTSSSSPINSLAVTADRLFTVVDGTLHAWVLGDTNISWSKSDDYLSTTLLLDGTGNVYAASTSKLYSLDPDGTPLWDYNLDAAYVHPWPSYNGGAVFITFDNFMAAVNISNGSQRWIKDITWWHPDWQSFTGSVIGPDGTVWTGRIAYGVLNDYVTMDPNTGDSALGIPPPHSNAMLYAITDSRMLLFLGNQHMVGGTYEMAGPSITEDFDVNLGFYPSTLLTIATDHIYQGSSDGTLYAHNGASVDADGSEFWAFDLDLSGAYPQGTMAVNQYGTLYIPLSDGSLAAVGEAPIAVAGPKSGGVSVPISFSSAGSGPGIPTDTISYYWDFGDDTDSTDANPTKTYDTGGDYTVVFTVTVNETGATAVNSFTFTADDVPPGIEVAEALLYGTVDDQHVPPTISVNGSDVAVEPTLHTWESGLITLETGGPTSIDIIATDANMQSTTVTVTITP